MRTFIPILIIVCCLFSCVSSKNMTYLQGEPLTNKQVHRINDQPYRLQVHDVLSIQIKAKNQELVALFDKEIKSGSGSQSSSQGQLGYAVDRHGNIRLPYLGELNVLGYTTKEVRYKIEQEVGKLFKNKDDFFVSVDMAGIRYTIIGEINSPGPKVIQQNKVTIIDAITFAGDIPVTGNKKQVELWRTTGSDKKKFTIDLTDVAAFDSEIYYIQPNDIINVLPIKQKSWGVGTTGIQSLTTIISIFSVVTSSILLLRNL